MRRIAVVLVAAAALLPLSADPSWACSCAPASPRAHAADAEVIFTGTAVDVPDLILTTRYTVQFRAAVAYKGPVRPVMRVTTMMNGGSCGYEFEEGTRYTVFADAERGRLETHLCTATTTGDIDADRFGLSGTSMGHPPDLRIGSGWWPSVAAALAAAVFAALLVTRRRLRSRG